MSSPFSFLAPLRNLPFVGWLFLYCALLWGTFGALLGAVTPNLRAQMGVSFQDVGWLMAIWSGGSVIGSLLGGAVAKRWPPRKLLMVYTVLVVVSLVGVLLASTFFWLAVFMVSIATFETALFTLGHGLLAELSDDPEQRTRIIGLVDVGYSLGTVISPLLVTGALWLSTSWRAPYAVFGVLLLGMLFMSLQTRRLSTVQFRGQGGPVSVAPPTPARTMAPKHAEVEAAAEPDAGARQPMASAVAHGYLGLLRQPVVRWVVLAGIFAGLCEWGQYFWFVSYAHETLDVNEQSARLVLGFLMAGMVTGRIWQAFFPSRFSMEQKIQGLGVLAAVSLWALWLTPAGVPWAWLALCNFGAGLGVSVAFPILLGIALRAFAHDAPRLSALLMIAIALGSQVAGVLMGGLAQWLGLRVAYGTLALASAAFVYCVWRLVRQVRFAPADVGALERSAAG
ncbi:MFS transporter [Hydrogenophaga sp. PAMC20947]|uniref:MFS transporter n=1 Tax=Hydrogenophaga sp. PAMC20947 TaxID=2565558 RepID=UPI0014488196|nr:MFS transporter [Hydrogenophaga sp. PAMC20947]